MRDDSIAWGRAGYPPVCVGRYRDAAEQIERLTRWRPISTCPKDGMPFLAGWWSGMSDGSYWWTCKAHWANGVVDGGWDGARESYHLERATHWLPMPTPPPPQKADGGS